VTTPCFPCARCGATLQYAPGTVSLTCPYCKSTQAIPQAAADTLAAAVEGQDLETALRAAADEHTTEEVLTVKCGSCGAESSFAKNVTADRCSFCGTPLVAEAQSKKAFRPKALLPFKIGQSDAGARFRDWVRGLWFAPSRIKKEAAAGRIDGVYLPFWTYDCETQTSYRGQRGDDYSVQETDSRGQTRTVTRTTWTHASGSVSCSFDNLLVPATGSLPRSYVAALEPWDLQGLVPYADSYLSGFRTESYALDLKAGFDVARSIIEQRIRGLIAHEIGGDHQRIESSSTSYGSLTFKHVLLPVWISSYRFGAKVYRFLVNGRTGEVQGERPWSWVKILLAVIAALLALLVLSRLSN
jgi:hypothetical protein